MYCTSAPYNPLNCIQLQIHFIINLATFTQHHINQMCMFHMIFQVLSLQNKKKLFTERLTVNQHKETVS